MKIEVLSKQDMLSDLEKTMTTFLWMLLITGTSSVVYVILGTCRPDQSANNHNSNTMTTQIAPAASVAGSHSNLSSGNWSRIGDKSTPGGEARAVTYEIMSQVTCDAYPREEILRNAERIISSIRDSQNTFIDDRRDVYNGVVGGLLDSLAEEVERSTIATSFDPALLECADNAIAAVEAWPFQRERTKRNLDKIIHQLNLVKKARELSNDDTFHINRALVAATIARDFVF